MADTRSYVCIDCGVGGEQAARGRPRLRCEACAKAYGRFDVYRSRQLPQRACVRCGRSFASPAERSTCSPRCERMAATSLEQRRERLLEFQRQAGRRRRAALRGGISEPYTLAEIASRDRFRCGLCGKRVAMKQVVPHPKAPTIDHIIPVSEGGDDVRANVQLAHFVCNLRKGVGGSQQLALIG